MTLLDNKTVVVVAVRTVTRAIHIAKASTVYYRRTTGHWIPSSCMVPQTLHRSSIILQGATECFMPWFVIQMTRLFLVDGRHCASVMRKPKTKTPYLVSKTVAFLWQFSYCQRRTILDTTQHPPNLHLASSEQWCWSGGRGILTELSLCYSIV